MKNLNINLLSCDNSNNSTPENLSNTSALGSFSSEISSKNEQELHHTINYENENISCEPSIVDLKGQPPPPPKPPRLFLGPKEPESDQE